MQDLWKLTFPDREPPARKHKDWGDLGFQQQDPQSDFRGGGMISLDLILLLAMQHREEYMAMLGRSKGATPLVNIHSTLLHDQCHASI